MTSQAFPPTKITHYTVCEFPCRAMEWIIAGHPKLVNLQKTEDGYTPLHIAAANNHPDIAYLLAQQVGIQSPCCLLWSVCEYAYHVIASGHVACMEVIVKDALPGKSIVTCITYILFRWWVKAAIHNYLNFHQHNIVSLFTHYRRTAT